MRLPDVFSNKRAPLPWGIGMRPMRIPASIAYGLPLPAGEYVGDDIDREEWEGLAMPLQKWRIT